VIIIFAKLAMWDHRNKDWLACSVVFVRPQWTKTAASRWLEEHNFSEAELQMVEDRIQYRIRPPERFIRFRTKKLEYGVDMIFGAAE